MEDYVSKFTLSGRTAFVTGGTGLIGKEVAIALSQAGANVLILDIDSQRGVALEKECERKKLRAKFIFFDVTNTKQCEKTIERMFLQEGAADIWINAAYPRTKDWDHYTVEKFSPRSWQENVRIQMDSCCLLTMEVARQMKHNSIKGSIINYGSIYGVVGSDFEMYQDTGMSTLPPPYAAIKGGIVNFSRYAASYYGRYGIRINCLCPGGIFNNQNPRFVKYYETRVPLKRMAKPEEIAAVTLFLASEASSYITGSTIMVDGGWTCI